LRDFAPLCALTDERSFPMKPIAIDDFCAVRSLANVTFSPEGTSACFTVSQAKKEKIATNPASIF